MPRDTVERITDHRVRAGRTERGDIMHSDIWYDLAIRELSDLSDPVKEKLAEAAAETLAAPEVEAEEESAAPADPPASASEPGEPPLD
jgi:hypothetical protein